MKFSTKVRLLAIIARWRLTWDKRDTSYRPADSANPKFVCALDAVRMIEDGSCVISSGMAAHARCSIFFWAVKELFQAGGHPRDLTWLVVGAQGSRGKLPGTLDELEQPGIITHYVGGHLETIKALLKLADQGHLDLQALPQGIMTSLIESQSRGENTMLSDVGLGTFLDPRTGEGSQVLPGVGESLIGVEGDLLRYRLPRITVAMFSAPYADAEGNIYMHNAATYTESLESSLAARHNGGKVLVAVSEVIPKDESGIFLKADKVDAIVVNPRNEQTGAVPQKKYWPMFTLGADVDVRDAVEQLKFVNTVMRITPVRKAPELAMARLAASLFTRIAHQGANVNIGVGLPEEVCRLIYEGGLHRDVSFGTETGVWGGLPTPGIFFGASINPRKMMTSHQIFQFWKDNLDVTILGLLQADSQGNVNVSKRGEGAINYVGPGGFPDLVAAAKNIIFIGAWMAHAEMDIIDGKLVIKKPGVPKFVEQVDQVTMSGRRALELEKNVYYVTNVGVFKLTPAGMTLIEVMPGVEVKRDIIEFSPMKVVLPERDIPVVEKSIVTGQGFRLAWSL